MACLIVRVVGRPDRRFDLLKTETVIGREDSADLVLPNVSVSRRHATLVRGEDEAIIVDLGSQNGVLVNGDKTPTGPPDWWGAPGRR